MTNKKNFFLCLLILIAYLEISCQQKNNSPQKKIRDELKKKKQYEKLTSLIVDELRFSPETSYSTSCIYTPKNKNVSLLVKELSNTDWYIRVNSAKALGYIGKNAKKAIPKLIYNVLNDKNEYGRAHAIQTLGLVGSNSNQIKEIISIFTKILNKENSKLIKLNTIEALGNLGKDAQETIPTLINFLDKNFFRYKTALTISRIAPKTNGIFSTITQAIKEQNSLHCSEIAIALSYIEPTVKNSVQFIIQILKTSKNDTVRAKATWILGLFGKRAKDAINILLHSLKDKSQNVRRNAIWALALIIEENKNIDKLIPVFIKALKDKYWEVRRNAVWGLGIFGKKSNKAIPDLLSALKNENHMVKEQIIDSLEKITGKKYQ